MPKRAYIDMDLAQRLYAEGKSWDEIGAACGVTAETIRRRLDPVYAQKRREQRKAFLEGKAPPRFRVEVAKLTPVLRVPEDTRTPVQRWLGDPIPGRSAVLSKGRINA